MEIIIKKMFIRFKNPQTGQPTRKVEEHYYGRRVVASVDGVDRNFVFTADELPFIVDEEDVIQAIKDKLSA